MSIPGYDRWKTRSDLDDLPPEDGAPCRFGEDGYCEYCSEPADGTCPRMDFWKRRP